MSTAPTRLHRHSTHTAVATPSQSDHQLLDVALHDPANRFLRHTGKRFRASVINESYRAAGGRGDVPKQIAEAIELLHAGSLIIDDIEDSSETRRGHATLHREVGLPIALNVGNWLYFQSLERLSETPLSPRLTQAMLTRSIRTVRRCHEGQAMDLGASVDSVPIDQIYGIARDISRLKTGGLTALSAWLGAAAAGADSDHRKALSSFGMVAGVCLQMKNDLQELRRFVNGDVRCDDLRNARVTWAWAWASRTVTEQKMIALQKRLRNACGDRDEYRAVAETLLGIIGTRGDDYVQRKLQNSLRLLGRCVGSTRGLQLTLQRLQSKR
ncbi:MAG: polyprenyl synthetase family protein [Rubripirellula sp.]|nr:polyprenyl synthetase family protein [Rubripirellula sp.]